MPLPRLCHSLALLALTVCFSARANELNWVSTDEMQKLPPAERVEIPAWCGGTYHNPAFFRPVETRDTVISADESSLEPEGEADLSGDVRIRQPLRRLRADQARYDQQSGDFELTGDIRMESPGMTFNAEQMSGPRGNREARLEQANYAIFRAHARGEAETMRQNGPLIHIDQGAYTTCEPGNDSWLFKARKLELNRDSGWGEARDVTLSVEGWPVFWVPWLLFPIDDRRKTGLLYPTLVSADGGGVDYTQPLYLNLHPQLDATIAPRHIHGRGNGLENELRYLTGAGEGSLSYAWLRNDRTFDDRDRELARWEHDGSLGRWSFDADVNYASDDFYFKDLDTGLEVSSQTRLPRTGRARYRDRTWQAQIRAQSWQILDPNLASRNEPYRRMPQLQLSGDPELLGPLQLNWFSDVTRFDHTTASETNGREAGSRLHLEPALSLPLDQPWGYIEPRARFYHTQYRLNATPTPPEQRPERNLAGASLDSGLFLERPLFDGDWRQTLEPRLFLNKVEYEDQSNLPRFDPGRLTFSWNNLFRENRFSGHDRIGDEEKLALGVTSRFIDNETGAEHLRLRAGQGFFREDRRVTLSGTPDRSEQTPLVADAQWRLNDRWYARSEIQWDTDLNEHVRSAASMGYHGGPRRHLHAGYLEREQPSSTNPALQQGELAGLWPVHDHWSLIGRWLYDLDNHRSLETMAGVEYRDCCWNIRLVNHRELTDGNGDTQLEADRTFMLQIQLVGLGDFGGRIDRLLERSLPRYEAR